MSEQNLPSWFSFQPSTGQLDRQVPDVGTKISILSITDSRYEGVLLAIDRTASTIAAGAVRSFGTEYRVTSNPVSPLRDIIHYLIFKAQVIKDICVIPYFTTVPLPMPYQPPPQQPQPQQQPPPPSTQPPSVQALFSHPAAAAWGPVPGATPGMVGNPMMHMQLRRMHPATAGQYTSMIQQGLLQASHVPQLTQCYHREMEPGVYLPPVAIMPVLWVSPSQTAQVQAAHAEAAAKMQQQQQERLKQHELQQQLHQQQQQMLLQQEQQKEAHRHQQLLLQQEQAKQFLEQQLLLQQGHHKEQQRQQHMEQQRHHHQMEQQRQQQILLQQEQQQEQKRREQQQMQQEHEHEHLRQHQRQQLRQEIPFLGNAPQNANDSFDHGQAPEQRDKSPSPPPLERVSQVLQGLQLTYPLFGSTGSGDESPPQDVGSSLQEAFSFFTDGLRPTEKHGEGGQPYDFNHMLAVGNSGGRRGYQQQECERSPREYALRPPSYYGRANYASVLRSVPNKQAAPRPQIPPPPPPPPPIPHDAELEFDSCDSDYNFEEANRQFQKLMMDEAAGGPPLPPTPGEFETDKPDDELEAERQREFFDKKRKFFDNFRYDSAAEDVGKENVEEAWAKLPAPVGAGAVKKSYAANRPSNLRGRGQARSIGRQSRYSALSEVNDDY